MSGISDQFLGNLSRMGVPMAYGEKVQLGDSAIVPVAIASFGFGSGEGEGDGEFGDAARESTDGGARGGGRGQGEGGGGASIPIGAYVSDDFGTRFQPNVIALLVAVLPLAVVAGWALPRIIKALKR